MLSNDAEIYYKPHIPFRVGYVHPHSRSVDRALIQSFGAMLKSTSVFAFLCAV